MVERKHLYFLEEGNRLSNQVACLFSPSKSAALEFSIICSPLLCWLEKAASKHILGFTFIKSSYLESLKDKRCRAKISKWPLRVLKFLIKEKYFYSRPSSFVLKIIFFLKQLNQSHCTWKSIVFWYSLQSQILLKY